MNPPPLFLPIMGWRCWCVPTIDGKRAVVIAGRVKVRPFSYAKFFDAIQVRHEAGRLLSIDSWVLALMSGHGF